jgi:hypothetical protein
MAREQQGSTSEKPADPPHEATLTPHDIHLNPLSARNNLASASGDFVFDVAFPAVRRCFLLLSHM